MNGKLLRFPPAGAAAKGTVATAPPSGSGPAELVSGWKRANFVLMAAMGRAVASASPSAMTTRLCIE